MHVVYRHRLLTYFPSSSSYLGTFAQIRYSNITMEDRWRRRFLASEFSKSEDVLSSPERCQSFILSKQKTILLLDSIYVS